MNFREVIQFLFDNWDKVKLAIEFLKRIGVIGAGEDGTVTLNAFVLADVESQAVAEGIGGDVLELIRLLLANLDKLMELIELIRG